MQQVNASRATSANIFVDGLDYTNVELRNFNLAYTATAPDTTGIALKAVGGRLAKASTPQYGRTSLFAGALADNFISFQAIVRYLRKG